MKEEKLGFYELFYIFILGCLFGYLIEGLWSFYRYRIFINHSALIIGPVNVVYGLAATVFSYLLYKHRNKNILLIFGMSFAIGTVLEYILSFIMEKLVGFVAWNYSRYFLNINGRVCLKYSLFWGLLGLLWIKLFYPIVMNVINSFNKNKAKVIMNILIVFLLVDTFFTFQAIDRAKEYEKGIPPSSKYEEVLDQYYGIVYLDEMYNMRWNRK